MVPATGTPLRAHRRRPVNLPRRVVVDVNERGLPTAIGRLDGSTVGRIGEQPTVQPFNRLTVDSIGEVWRVYDEWWRQPIMRRYFEIVLSGGKHTIIYQDEVSGEWFEQTP